MALQNIEVDKAAMLNRFNLYSKEVANINMLYLSRSFLFLPPLRT